MKIARNARSVKVSDESLICSDKEQWRSFMSVSCQANHSTWSVCGIDSRRALANSF